MVNLPNIKIKSPIFISTLILFVIVMIATFLVPKENWKKIFAINNFATTFNQTNTGNWNTPSIWGMVGSSISMLRASGIAISPNTGKIYVSGRDSNSLVIIGPNNIPLTSTTTIGLSTPLGIYIDPLTDRVYIASAGNNSIVIANSDGSYYGSFGGATLYNGLALNNPSAVAIRGDYVYITDMNNHRVVVTDLAGNASTTYDGVVTTPLGIDFSPTGEIYVVSGFNLIKVLNSDGTASSSPGFPAPFSYGIWGIKFSPIGQLYVSLFQSPGSSAVGLLDENLNLVGQYNNSDASYSPNNMDYLNNIAIATSGVIYGSVLFDYGSVIIFNPDGSSYGRIINGDQTAVIPQEGVTYPGINDDVTMTNCSRITLSEEHNVKNINIICGPLDLNGNTLNVYGNMTTRGYSFEGNGGSLNLSTSSDLSINSSGTFILPNDTDVSTINLTGATFDLNGKTLNVYQDFYFDGPLTLNSGHIYAVGATSALRLASNTFTMPNDMSIYFFESFGTGSIFDLNGFTLNVSGQFRLSGTFTANGGFVYTSTSSTMSIEQSADFVMPNDMDVSNLTISEGSSLNLNSHTLNVFGNIDFINSAGAILSNGGILHTSTSSNLTLISGVTFVLPNDMDISNITIPSGATLDLNGHTLNIYGNWNNLGGTFLANGGTVNFMSPNTQIILGNNTFYNLSKISSTNSSLISASLSTTTVTNNITLSGSAGSLLYIGLGLDQSYTFSRSINNSSAGLPNPPYSGFMGINGVAVDSFGNVYEVEQGGRVGKFDSNLNYLSSFTFSGCGPRALVLDTSDNIYVNDGCNRVMKFDSIGTLLWTIGSTTPNSGTGNGEFYNPAGMSFDSFGNLYVVDQNNNRIQKFDSSGNFIWWLGYDGSTIGTHTSGTGVSGSGDGQFNNPYGVAVDSQGYIYISDTNNNRVQKFDSNGVYQSKFGSPALPDDGYFYAPYGIDIDSGDNIFVADCGKSIIDKFDSSGNFVEKFTYQDIGESSSGCPSDVALDSQNNVYVSYSGYSAIKKFIIPTTGSFNILKTGSGTASFSYLNVSGSNNLSSSPFYCMTGCVDAGNNTNWIFSTRRRSQPIYIPETPVIPALEVSTTAATTTTIEKPAVTPPIIETPIQQEPRIEESFCFTQNLFPMPNTTNDSLQIYKLQIFLNDYGFPVNTSGPGSYGYETYYYGPKTTAAVKSFQEYYANDILVPTNRTEGTGKFSNYTRKKTNDLLGNECSTIFYEDKTKIPEPEKEVIATTTPEEIIVTTATTTSLEPTIPETVKEKPIEAPKDVPKDQLKFPDLNDLFNQVLDSTLIVGVMETIKDSYGQVSLIIQNVIPKIRELMNDPQVSLSTKIISTTALVFGVTASVGAIAFATPVSFSEVWLIPARMFGLLAGAFGIRRKQRQWGTVYDSVTKRPLDPVYVSLVSTETNKEIAGAITDIDGRYGFLVLPGKYKIVATKTNYIQPSKKMAGKSFDEVYNDLYFGEELIVTEGEMITKNIPMDSLSFDWNEFAKTKMNVNKFTKQKDITWAKFSKLLFTIGALISIMAVVFAPQPYNYVIAGFYVLAYILNYVVLKTKKSGTLTEKNTNIPLSFAIITIFREGETSPLTKKIADKFGSYYALIPNGKYFIKVEKKNDDGTYSEVFQSSILDITKGVVNFNWSL